MIRIFCILLLAGALYGTPALGAAKGVVLNFNEVDISTMVKFISDLTEKNFVLDDRVKGKVSIFSPSKLSIEEAYGVFTSVLELKGFSVVPSGKVLKIVPTASIKTSAFSLLPSGERPPVNESYIAQVIKLENISAQEALPFLQPLVSKDGGISAFGSSNLLVLDSAINLRKIQDILKMIDTERIREGIEVIFLKNAVAESAAKAIQQWLAGGENKPAGQTSGSSMGSVLADQRLNALIVFGNQNIKQAIRELVAKLDVSPPEANSKVNVHYLENADATEMAKVLDAVVKGISAPGGAPQASPFDSGKVTITPDKATNSLVIMASTSDYNNILQVIKKLDRRSKQVFVQVVIAEVSLDKSRQLGVQAGAIGAGVIGKYIQGGAMYDPFGTFGQILNSSSSTGAGISTIIQGSLATASSVNGTTTNTTINKPVTSMALLQALDANGLLNVLSTPNILTSDNKEAEIFVGENVPFQGASTLSTTGTTQSVDRKDIGINLKLKPQISEGDYIRLDINQEISAVKDTITIGAGSTDRTTTKRSAKTSIVVKDNETVVIGGLIQDQENNSVSKVPLLGDIPLLGWLFKTNNKTRQKTNLMILLIPRIVKDSADLSTISDTQREKFGKSAKEDTPVDVQKGISGK
ncbi:MAG: type II secretion system secretin GspD [Deltaproteobacteria bacterium]